MTALTISATEYLRLLEVGGSETKAAHITVTSTLPFPNQNLEFLPIPTQFTDVLVIHENGPTRFNHHASHLLVRDNHSVKYIEEGAHCTTTLLRGCAVETIAGKFGTIIITQCPHLQKLAISAEELHIPLHQAKLLLDLKQQPQIIRLEVGTDIDITLHQRLVPSYISLLRLLKSHKEDQLEHYQEISALANVTAEEKENNGIFVTDLLPLHDTSLSDIQLRLKKLAEEKIKSNCPQRRR